MCNLTKLIQLIFHKIILYNCTSTIMKEGRLVIVLAGVGRFLKERIQCPNCLIL